MIIEISPNEPPETEDLLRQASRILYIGTGIDVTIVRNPLVAGDWRIVDDDGRELEPLAVERKSIYFDQDTGSYSNDAIASRNDGRWETQREDMATSEESVLYGVTGYFDRMTNSERRSVITYLMSLWRLGIMASWFPKDEDLVHASLKLFEMKPGFIPEGKHKESAGDNIDFCAGVFIPQRGISKATAVGIAKLVRIPARANELTPWDLSHLLRKMAGNEDKPSLIAVAVRWYCRWWGMNPDQFIASVKQRYKENRTACRTCNGTGRLFDDGGYASCTACDGTGEKKKKPRAPKLTSTEE